ncbi:hypothetical protein TIFTF001_036106 [Ficus carica]|uniref:Uncharacterized protein n=1 Tax=Ficus carica TaxID=3494 RepID=A0AA88JAC3_FICCA|nr:hypothetical protein TIFTF001_036106 [Ficus carica]
MTTPKVDTFLTGLAGSGQAGLENQQVQVVLAGFRDRPDRSQSGRFGKPTSARKNRTALVLALALPDRSCRSGIFFSGPG